MVRRGSVHLLSDSSFVRKATEARQVAKPRTPNETDRMGRILVPVPCHAESAAAVLGGVREVVLRDRSVGQPLRLPSHRGES